MKTNYLQFNLSGLISSTLIVLLIMAFFCIEPHAQTVNLIENPYADVNWSTYNQYKSNHHTHTTNSDGQQSPSDVINEYYNAGYDILAISDHNYATWPWPINPGMLAIKGDEYSQSHHMNAFLNFTITNTNLENGIPHVQANDGKSQINHPGRYNSAANWSWYIPWFTDYSTCLVLEVFNQGDRYPDDRQLWDNINENLFPDIGKFAWGSSNDDKHTPSHLYGNFNFMLMPDLTENAWEECIEKGAFYFCYEPGRSGNADVPRISDIEVDIISKTITITGSGYNSIEWIGPGTTVVSTGNVFDYSSYIDEPFIRAVLDGSNGDSYTQPFGFETIVDNPVCTITAPSNGTHYNSPQTISIEANASDPNGTVSSVEFFVDGSSVGSDNTEPYAVNWTMPGPGDYDIHAVATDDEGLTGSSSVVTISVTNGDAPTVSITSPTDGQYYSGPQSISIQADAVDTDGTIISVEFFVDGNSISTDNSSPYSIDWTIPAAGNYDIHAKATDDSGNESVSSTVSITVGVIDFSRQISNGDDDVEEGEGDGNIYTNSSDLELVYDDYNSQGNQIVGLRFNNITIPQGANIETAYIQFTVDETGTGSNTLTLTGHDTDNATAFSTSSYNVSSRPKTSASQPWSFPSWDFVGATGVYQQTPDISNVVQEIVDRGGWSSGNSMVMIIEGSGSRIAESYDGSASQAPQLFITYTTGSSNYNPVAVNDSGVTFQTIPVVVDVLANDSDPGGSLDPNSVQVVSGPANGTVSVNPANGEITYTPNSGFSGIDNFDYEVCDDGVPPPVLCTTATVSIDVQTNDAPVANDDVETTNESTSVVISVLDNDTDVNDNLDPSTVQIVISPANGTVSVAPSGDIDYSPNLGFDGQDVFTYEVADELGAVSNAATVTVDVLPNLPPVADDDAANTIDGIAVVIDVLANDSDPNGDLDPGSISTAGVMAPLHGSSLAIAGVGVEYTPDPGFTGYDQFEYKVCDLSNPAPLCDVATVTVLVDCGSVTGYNLISGTVFEDDNQDGLNILENGQSGVGVILYNDNNQNSILDAGDTQEATTTTGSDGGYSFSITPVYYTPGSLSVAISQDSDDAWEKDNGDVENDKDDHEIGKIDFWPALRFQNLNIPAGAVITNAYVEYTSSRNEDNTPAEVNFYTELNSSPATFIEEDYGITSRNLSTGNVYWNLGEWFQNNLYHSPDLSSIIQEVIDLGTWNSGNDLVILAQGLGSQKRKYLTHDKDPNLAPRLFVDYLIPGQDDYYYVVEIDPATLPGAALLTTDNIETAHFTALGQTDCLNDFGFFPGFPPTVSMTNPANGTTFTSLQTINLEATATDADGTVTSVEFFVDGVSVGVDVTSPYSASYAISLNGDYEINALATDNDGFSTLSAIHTITMDVPNALPDVTITAPADGAFYTSVQSVDLAATVSDDGTVTQVEFFVDGFSVGVDYSDPYAASFLLDTEGVHTIEVVATDNLGETGNSQISITLDIPNDPPAVSITDPTDGQLFLGPQLITITADGSDPDGSVSQVEFFVNGGSIGIDNSAPFTFDYDIQTVGFYTLHAEATDDMGAVTISDPVEIEMQAVPTPVSFSVQSDSDDAREKNDGKVEDDKNPNELGKEGYIGVRFQGVTIPAGANILDARVVFKSQNDEDNTPSSARIYGQANPNPQTFIETKWDISSRAQTTNFVDWSFDEWFKNQLYSSPDLTSIVQELVDQSGWQSGNSMAFIFDATGSQRRKAYAYEESPADGPQLEITYMGGGPGQKVAQKGNTIVQPQAQQSLDNFRVYPNPTDYQLFIEFESSKEGSFTINLYDVTGRLIRTQEYQAIIGLNKVDFSTRTGQAGVHYIHLQIEEVSMLEKVILRNR